jgi:hypothetical protein
MTKGQSICAHICLFIVVLLIIMLPILYFVVIPNFLQYKVDRIGKYGHTIRIHKAFVGDITNDTINMSADFRIDAMVPLPLHGGFKANTIRILGDGKEIMSLHAPEQQFWLNKEIALQMDNHLTINEEQRKNLQDIVRRFSSPEGLKNFVVRLEMSPPITAHGMTVYRALPLHRDIPLGDLIGTAKGLLSSPKDAHHKSPLIFKGPDPSKAGQALRNKFNAEDIMKLPASLGGLEMLWKSFDFAMRDEGVTTELGAAFENPKYVALKKLNSIDYFLAIEDVRIMKMSIFNLELKPELNDDMKVGFDFSFIDPRIDAKAAQGAIEKATKSYAETGDFGFALMGPITVSNAGFVQQITQDLKVSGTLNEILTLAPKSVFRFVAADTPASEDVIQDIIGKSKIALNVLGDRISAELGLNIPMMEFLKPPKQISFPYQASISLFADNAKVIQADVSPVTIQRENRGLMVNTGFSVVPANTEAAADGLAKAINPILSSNPTPSSIGIKDLYFAPVGGQPFKWCRDLFAERVLTITLPAIDKVALVDTFANPSTSNAAKKVSALVNGPINVAQLTDRPGFGANGNVQITYNETLPEVRVDLGFFHVDTTVESVRLASLEMPNGLKFFPQSGGTAINAAVVLNRDEQLEGKIQKLADSVLGNSETPSHFGFTNLRFGTSSANQLITFSKIVVDLDTASIKKLLDGSGAPSTSLPLKPGMIKLDSLDLTVNSATELSASVSSRIENPLSQLTVSIGSIGLNTIIDGQDLMGMSISPIRLTTGANALPLTMGLRPVRGGNGLEQKVATFANAILERNEAINMQFAFTGLTLTPPGVTGGSAVIDQFRNVRIGMSAANIVKGMKSGSENSGGSGVIDTSALMPSGDLLSQLGLSVKYLQLDVQPNQRIASGVDVDYNNPLPISANVPFLSLNTVVDGSEALDVEIAGVSLSRQAGSMKPRMNLVFRRDVSDKIGKLVGNFLEGKRDSRIVVKGIQFGASAQDRNTLFSGISLDVSRVIESGPSIAKSLQQVGASLRGLNKRQVQQDPLLNIEGPNGSSLNLNTVDLELTPSKLINAKIGAGLQLPMALDLNVPYFSINTGLDDTKALDLSMSVSAKGTNPAMQLTTGIQIHDTEELATKVAGLVDAVLHKKELNGMLKISGVAIGTSKDDVIDALTRIEAGLPIRKLMGNTPSSASPAGNSTQLIQDIAVQLGTINLQTKPGRTIAVNAGLQFNSRFQVTLKGFNYLSVNTAVDQHPIMQIASTSGFTVTPGTNNINAGLELTFPSSEGAQDAVAQFVDDLKTKPGNTPQKLVASNIAFGPDRDNALRVLSKVVARFESASVITKGSIDQVMGIIKQKLGETDASGSLRNAFIRKFILQTPSDGRIYSEMVTGVRDTQFNADVEVGFAGFSAILDQQK